MQIARSQPISRVLRRFYPPLLSTCQLSHVFQKPSTSKLAFLHQMKTLLLMHFRQREIYRHRLRRERKFHLRNDAPITRHCLQQTAQRGSSFQGFLSFTFVSRLDESQALIRIHVDIESIENRSINNGEKSARNSCFRSIQRSVRLNIGSNEAGLRLPSAEEEEKTKH